ncbi:unnamed protein product [Victoria cruziana]
MPEPSFSSFFFIFISLISRRMRKAPIFEDVRLALVTFPVRLSLLSVFCNIFIQVFHHEAPKTEVSGPAKEKINYEAKKKEQAVDMAE